MSVALPWVLVAAAVGAVVVGLLHFMARRTPTPLSLPTARFLPVGEAPVTSVQRALDDRRLLLLRWLALGSLALGAAGTRCDSTGATTGYVVVVDSALARDSTRWLTGVMGDGQPIPRSAIRLVLSPVADEPSVAIVDALQAAASVAREQPAVKHLALHLVVPDSVRSDEGWRGWRAQWPATIDFRVVARPAGDPVPAAVASMPPVPVIRWSPRPGASEGLRGFSPRRVTDTVGALVAGGVPIVAPWIRRWAVTARSSLAGTGVGHPIAWWNDGEPAVLEFPTPTGCERSVAVDVPAGSDLLMAPAAVGWERTMAAPCGHAADVPRMASSQLVADSMPRGVIWPRTLAADWLRVDGEKTLAPTPGWWVPGFLAVALLLLGIEVWWRNRVRA
jgi:hypothetical protein